MQFELSTIQYIQQPAFMQHHIKLTCSTLLALFSAVDAPSTPLRPFRLDISLTYIFIRYLICLLWNAINFSVSTTFFYRSRN